MKITKATFTDTHAEMTLADREPDDLDRQWIAFRVEVSPMDARWSLAKVQLAALRAAQSAIDAEIARLSHLLDPTA